MPTAKKLNPTLVKFIEKQQMFFVASADLDGRVNVSPKGMDRLRVMDENRIVWMNLSGSGNETAAHVRATGRMTLMFCSFEGDALILRTYGTAKVVHRRDEAWEELSGLFPAAVANRQIFDLNVDLVQTSCGTGVPLMDFKAHRRDEEMLPFYEDMGEDGIVDYWSRKNVETIDGKPTHLFDDQAS